MKVVFLDIDGVLQPYNVPLRFDNLSIKKIDELSRKWDVDYSKYNINEISSVYYDWDELAIARLKYILKETNARIIMSSEWRSKEQLYKMRDLLRIHYLGDYWACDNVILEKCFYEEMKKQNKLDILKEDIIERNHKINRLSYAEDEDEDEDISFEIREKEKIEEIIEKDDIDSFRLISNEGNFNFNGKIKKLNKQYEYTEIPMILYCIFQ